jgi:hypothetical protein
MDESKKLYPKSSPPVKWLKVMVPAGLHEDLTSKCKELKITLPEGVELSIKRWIQE